MYKISLIVVVIVIALICLSCSTVPKGQIQEIETLNIGGINQYIYHSGDPTKPVLLILHGGGLPLPGIASKNRYQTLSENFLVVYWDQRGTGLSTSDKLNKTNMRLIDYVNDVKEITAHLKSRYGREKIYLLGHSWGSMIGLEVIENAANDYYAYIGLSQQINLGNSDSAVYEELIGRLEAEGNETGMTQLRDLGAPPYKNVSDWLLLREIVAQNKGLVSGMGDIGMLGMVAEMVGGFIWNFDYPWFETFRINGNMNRTMENIYDEMMAYNRSGLNRLTIPTAFIHGKHDLNSHPQPLRKWYASLESPQKQLLEFSQSAHMPMWEEKAKFQEEVVKFFKFH